MSDLVNATRCPPLIDLRLNFLRMIRYDGRYRHITALTDPPELDEQLELWEVRDPYAGRAFCFTRTHDTHSAHEGERCVCGEKIP